MVIFICTQTPITKMFWFTGEWNRPYKLLNLSSMVFLVKFTVFTVYYYTVRKFN